MYQQLWGYKVEEKLYLGVREQKMVEYHWSILSLTIEKLATVSNFSQKLPPAAFLLY
jgi:hypothetical protein